MMFSDVTVLPVKEELGSVPAGKFSTALCRLGLGRVNRGRPLVALADHDPRIIPKLDVHGGFLSHILHILSVLLPWPRWQCVCPSILTRSRTFPTRYLHTVRCTGGEESYVRRRTEFS